MACSMRLPKMCGIDTAMAFACKRRNLKVERRVIPADDRCHLKPALLIG